MGAYTTLEIAGMAGETNIGFMIANDSVSPEEIQDEKLALRWKIARDFIKLIETTLQEG